MTKETELMPEQSKIELTIEMFSEIIESSIGHNSQFSNPAYQKIVLNMLDVERRKELLRKEDKALVTEAKNLNFTAGATRWIISQLKVGAEAACKKRQEYQEALIASGQCLLPFEEDQLGFISNDISKDLPDPITEAREVKSSGVTVPRKKTSYVAA